MILNLSHHMSGGTGIIERDAVLEACQFVENASYLEGDPSVEHAERWVRLLSANRDAARVECSEVERDGLGLVIDAFLEYERSNYDETDSERCEIAALAESAGAWA